MPKFVTIPKLSATNFSYESGARPRTLHSGLSMQNLFSGEARTYETKHDAGRLARYVHAGANKKTSEVMNDRKKPTRFHYMEIDKLPENIVKKRLCKNAPLDWFYPDKGSFPIGKRICVKCEVSDECLQFALENEIRFGVWGGLTDFQRKQISKS